MSQYNHYYQLTTYDLFTLTALPPPPLKDCPASSSSRRDLQKGLWHLNDILVGVG